MINKTPVKIQNMFNNIAFRYDLMNDIISFLQHRKVKKLAIKNLPEQNYENILDLCTGTGDIADILNKKFPNSNVCGLDFSENMLKIAQNKYPKIKFIQGDCLDLPFENDYFELITMSFGLRNIENTDIALQEVKRVLKKDGIFMHFDFGEGNILTNFIFNNLTPFFSIFFTDKNAYKYLVNSKKEFLKPDNLIDYIENQGLKFLYKKNFFFNTVSAIYFKNIDK